MRELYSEQAKYTIKENWLFGVGINNYINYVYNNIDSKSNGHYYQPVHNIYYLIFAEFGLVGILLLILLLLSYIREKWKIVSSKKCCLNNYQVIVIFLIFYIFLISFYDHYFYTMHFGIFLLGIISFIFLKNCNKVIGDSKNTLKNG